MQEGGFNMLLMDLLMMWGSKGYNKVNEIHFDNKGKCLVVVDSFNLKESFSN